VVLSLGSLAMRVFAANLERLYNNPRTNQHTRDHLSGLPDQLASRLFTALRRQCPELLTDVFLKTVRSCFCLFASWSGPEVE
jgi:hypothetical protein